MQPKIIITRYHLFECNEDIRDKSVKRPKLLVEQKTQVDSDEIGPSGNGGKTIG